MRVELVTDTRLANLTRREADMAIRLSRPAHGQFVISRIGQMASGLFASRAYTTRHGAETGDRGTGHLRVAWDEGQLDLPLARWLEDQLPASKVVLNTCSLRGQIEAAKAGLGIAGIPLFLADDLTRIGVATLRQDIFLIVHRDIRRTPRIDVTVNFLRSQFTDTQPLLTGEEFA